MLNPLTHTSDHPSSWYIHTANEINRHAPLRGKKTTGICVIGGGFSGINCAIELSSRGHQVTLLEAHKIGWGASGRNGGQLIRGLGDNLQQFNNEIGTEGIAAMRTMGLEAVDIVRERITEHDIQCDLSWGYCDLANKKRHLRDFEDELRWLSDEGYQHKTYLANKDDLGDIVGSDNYLGGLVDMGSGHLHPLNLCLGEAAIARQLGVDIYEDSPVKSITKGAQPKVATAHGEVCCDTLVICGNAYVEGLDPWLESHVLPAGSYIIATEPLSADAASQVLPSKMAVCDQRVALDYYRLTPDNRLLFGGLCTYSGRDPKSIEAALRPHLDKVFPYLKDVRIDFQWGGMIGIGANRMPQIGRLNSNIYYAQAYSGHGINVTHLAARVIAEHISGETDRLELFERIKHFRFPGGKKLRSPLLATGMLWYRFLDML